MFHVFQVETVTAMTEQDAIVAYSELIIRAAAGSQEYNAM
jgi:hypothetical protein